MFAKVFSRILESSIAEDYRVRLVFEDFLKLCDRRGIVDMTPEAIARRTNVPLDVVKHGISEMEKPDPRSRTPADEGRRIRRLDEHRDWGWIITNYEHYRNLKDDSDKAEYHRVYIAQYRADGKDKSRPVKSGKGGKGAGKAPVSGLSHAEAEAEADPKERESKPTRWDALRSDLLGTGKFDRLTAEQLAHAFRDNPSLDPEGADVRKHFRLAAEGNAGNVGSVMPWLSARVSELTPRAPTEFNRARRPTASELSPKGSPDL